MGIGDGKSDSAINSKRQTAQIAVASDQDIDALMRYYRARRLLLAATLLPLAAGGLYTDNVLACVASFGLVLAWAVLSRAGASMMGELVVYATGAGSLERSARWLALLWEDVRHLLAGYAGAAALLALLHMLHGQEFAPPTLRPQDYDADALLVFDRDRALFLLFWFSAFIPCMTAVMDDKRSNRRRWWLPVIAICVVSLPLGRYLLLLPFALALPIYLAGLASRSPERRHSLIVNAHDACGCSIAVLVLGMLFQFQLWAGAAPTVDLPAYFMFAFGCALWSFLQYERIRRGLFITDIDEVDHKKFNKGERRRFANAFRPLAKSGRHWRWIQLVLALHKHAWLFALASTAAAVALSFLSSP